jgi:MFS family permease
VSDLLEAAAKTLGTPSTLVQRSAAARAAAEGTDVDTILAAWAGGEAPPAPQREKEPEAAEEPAAEEAEVPAPEETEPAGEPAPPEQRPGAPSQIPKPPTVEVPSRVPEVVIEPEVELEPVPLGARVGAAMRVGAWTGAALGLVGFLIAGAYWAPNAIYLEEIGVVAVVSALGVMIGVALISILFGGIVASISRAAVSWVEPAMELSMSKRATGWVGAGLGLVLGLIAGGVLAGMGTDVEGSEGLIQLPILSTLIVVLLGGAVLGGLTAAIPQLLGTPVTIEDDDLEEVRTVKARLGDAVGIPLVGVALLALLVLPFAYLLIQSNHFLPRIGAAVVGILTAAGILAFAALAGNRPQMRISLGDAMVAVAGIGAVLLVILAVLFYSGADEAHEEEDGSEAAIVRLI